MKAGWMHVLHRQQKNYMELSWLVIWPLNRSMAYTSSRSPWATSWSSGQTAVSIPSRCTYTLPAKVGTASFLSYCVLPITFLHLNSLVFADALRHLKWSSPKTTRNSVELILKTPFSLLMFIHLVRISLICQTIWHPALEIRPYTMLVFRSGPGGRRCVQSPSGGLLGKTWPVLAACQSHGGALDQVE